MAQSLGPLRVLDQDHAEYGDRPGRDGGVVGVRDDPQQALGARQVALVGEHQGEVHPADLRPLARAPSRWRSGTRPPPPRTALPGEEVAEQVGGARRLDGVAGVHRTGQLLHHPVRLVARRPEHQAEVDPGDG
ncbi:hypothetical protein [Streptomyces sp. RKAG337]|uniref:hypothetical protein n=1 Tax=Streptomyces sp. RKAG337 TaxID=2893404 RepID=UPI00203423A1|nr:hypothetical protein [Streptomyces sp. RKAG337]MCM2424303.1 hypothetical protein [Streptomyces sp. RKAG337]